METGGATALGLLPFSSGGSSGSGASYSGRDLGEIGGDFDSLLPLQLDFRGAPASGPVETPALVDPEQSIPARSWDMPFEVSGVGRNDEEGLSDQGEKAERAIVQEDATDLLMSLEKEKYVSLGQAENGYLGNVEDYNRRRTPAALADLDVLAESSDSVRERLAAIPQFGGSAGGDFAAARGGQSRSTKAAVPEWYWRQQSAAWLNTLFPALPSPPSEPKQPKQPWPAEARELARSLLRIDA